MAKIYGQLEVAQLENLAADPASTATGYIYFNTVALFVKHYNGSVWKTLADTNSSQVFTNKDYDGGTASNTSRFTAPKGTAAGIGALTRKAGTLLFNTDDGLFYGDNGATLSSFATAALVGQGTAGLVAGAGQLLGTNTNDDAASGYVGEYQNLTGANPGITASTPSAGTGDITLGPGDYDVRAYCHYLGAGATADSLIAGVTTTNGTIVGSPGVDYSVSNGLTASNNNVTVCSPVVRISVAAASTQTVSAVGFAVFSAGSVDLTGNIEIRRVR